LRLIAESGLEDGGVEALAQRLGIGSRHLRRLFLRHLGATPVAVAHTRRMHFAKKLIDETSLPMNQIADASGFGSVRRFNAGIRKFYHRTPTRSDVSRDKRRSNLQTNMSSGSISAHHITGQESWTSWRFVVRLGLRQSKLGNIDGLSPWTEGTAILKSQLIKRGTSWFHGLNSRIRVGCS